MQADLATFGKALGNGMPISRDRRPRRAHGRASSEVFFSGTHGGEALSLAAARATLDAARRRGVRARCTPRASGCAARSRRRSPRTASARRRHRRRGAAHGRADRRARAAPSGLVARSLVQQELAKRGVLFNGTTSSASRTRDEDLDQAADAYDAAFARLADGLADGAAGVARAARGRAGVARVSPRRMTERASTRAFEIGGTPVGGDARCYVIAEAGANHNRDLGDRARAHRRRGRRGRRRGEVPDVHRQGPVLQPHAAGSSTSRTSARRRSCSTRSRCRASGSRCSPSTPPRAGSPFFSSPFDRAAVDELAALGVPAMKIASFELVDVGLIEYTAATGIPIIISTGMATYGEVEDALAAVAAGRQPRRSRCCAARRCIRRRRRS